MKEQFIQKRFGPDSLAIIASANEIIERYQADGFDLTLRQLYYQFISADLFPASWIDEEYNKKNGLPADTKNTERNYKNLGGIISDARLAGMIDWDAIEDRGRSMVRNSHWANPAEIIETCVRSFQIDKWADQPNYVEVMVEKQALEGILTPVCRSLDVPFTANKGYSSSSAMYACGKRFELQHKADKPCHIIYLGDHDPSGIDMTRDVDDRISMFSWAGEHGIEIEVHRVALNLDQIRKLNPPENPAKLTDSRASGYVAKFGLSSWELDAIEPKALASLVRGKIIALRDPDLWAKAEAREQAMRDELASFAKKSKFKA